MSSSKSVVRAALANLCWGLMPLYFVVLGPIRPEAILLMQVLMAYGVLTIIHATGLIPARQDIEQRSIKTSIVPALLISCNWLIYLFAMLTENAVDAGLGYLFTPFVIIGLSRLVFREKLASHQAIGGAICVVGVIFYIAITGVVPVFGFSLAITFGLYATWHRSQNVTDSVAALRRETSLMAPIAVIALMILIWQDHSIPIITWATLGFLGPLTLLPLFLFISACQLGISAVDLSACQFLAPVVSVAVGVLFMGQTLTVSLAMLLIFLAIGISVSVLGGSQRKGTVS
ncbi:EamA family transporter [Agrobacterium vitis]|uniref:EamA family transporter n=1 Tax=Agrobacterium vitis TaxID=373 RepID=UPI0018D1F7BC|nr:EamA family transporter [Agrobacterium vitis]